MGIASGDAVRFPADPPTLAAVRDAVARRTGLAVDLAATDEHGGLLTFACLPDMPVEVRCGVGPDGGRVEVSGALGHEPTLFFQTFEALHDLGGETDEGRLPADDPLL